MEIAAPCLGTHGYRKRVRVLCKIEIRGVDGRETPTRERVCASKFSAKRKGWAFIKLKKIESIVLAPS